MSELSIPVRRGWQEGRRFTLAAGVRGCLLLCLLTVAAAQLSGAGWIYLKAQLAQVLIARAWAQPGTSKPWPWADTWPLARLRVPAHEEDLFVLAGGQGNALAFGPGLMPDSALPGSTGITVIGGHRDTHFAFLGHLVPGDLLSLENKAGQIRRYRVSERRVADIRDGPLWLGGQGLVLVTCYPLDALRPGGPLRYVVIAQAEPLFP